MSALAPISTEVPAHLAPYVSDANKSLLGELEPSDFGIPFLKVCQGSSPQATKPGPNGEPPLPLGTMFLSRDRTIVPVGSAFIPLCRRVRYIKWRGKKPGDGGMEFATDDRDDPRILAIKSITTDHGPVAVPHGLAFGPNQEAPAVTKYVNWYVMTQYAAEPVILSFYRTSTPIGKDMTQNIIMATRGGTLPVWTLKYTLGDLKLKPGAAGNSWYQVTPVPAGHLTDPAIIERAKKLAKIAEELAATASDIGAADDDAEEAELKPVYSAPVGVPAAPAVVPPAAQTQPTGAPAVTAPAITTPPAQTAILTPPAQAQKLW